LEFSFKDITNRPACATKGFAICGRLPDGTASLYADSTQQNNLNEKTKIRDRRKLSDRKKTLDA
jgi:hypothetical protein